MPNFKDWFFEGQNIDHAAAGVREGTHHPQHPWWQVLCLTGVDYFSTLGYQPGIAALAAGALAPMATLLLVLLTLFGAVPIYSRVARQSPRGEGSIAMLEHLLRWWQGKLLVLVLLGFAATDFIITMTLSAADATAHIIENPFAPAWAPHYKVLITLFLLGLLGAVFLKGFKEAISIAVAMVALYLGLNFIVVAVGLAHVFMHPEYLTRWHFSLIKQTPSLTDMLAGSVIVFPRLALGLSGFETAVTVMPLVKSDDGSRIKGRIINTRKMLLAAALIMSVYLLASSVATTLAIPAREFLSSQSMLKTYGVDAAGAANGRALAYLAHLYLGNAFGTLYDVSTILILWFAGASALAALLNLVPRYLPRYGMAPQWTRASRPLVVVFTVLAFIVTLLFHADVDAQGGAYATGVLVLITSGAFAAMLSARHSGERKMAWMFGIICLIFLYTALQNIHERPEGLKIALVFIGVIVSISIVSRLFRNTELRVERYDFDDAANRFVNDEAKRGEIHIIANQPDERSVQGYQIKEKGQRIENHIPDEATVLFLEVVVNDPSEFADVLRVRGLHRYGQKILRVSATSVPNAIAAVLLHIRDTTGILPHAYFGWSEGNPFLHLLKYVAFGEGDTAPVTHEVLRRAEPDPTKRPAVHVGGG